jgi:signal peptidase
MTTRETLGTVLEVALVLLMLGLLAGQLLGQPFLLGFVQTGSMAPTMDPGDGFVAVPPSLAGEVEPGDVVTFEAETIQGGGLTTHRVVGETAEGYVTRGDANPFTDQDGGEPPVQDPQVVAVALELGGDVLVIPGLGTAATAVRDVASGAQVTLARLVGHGSLLGTTGLISLVAVSAGVLYVLDLVFLSGGDTRARTHERRRDGGSDPRVWVAAFALLLMLGATVAMIAPAGTQEYGIVSSEFDSDRPTTIRAGESATLDYRVQNAGVLPVVAYVEPVGEGVSVPHERFRVSSGGAATAAVTLEAPPETGYYRRYLVERHYVAVLPPSVIHDLYGVHPWLPIVTIDALLGGGFYVLGTSLVGSGPVRARSRAGPSLRRRVSTRLGLR